MKISHGIRESFGDETPVTGEDEIEAGMRAKAEEFTASGGRVYLPLAD